MFKKYYLLTKPGIIRGNAITALAGFLLASKGNIDIWLLLATIAGISLIMASGCVFNNYIDRNIDKKMTRTKSRALVIRSVPTINALIYASLIGIAGFILLSIYTNLTTVIIGVIGFVDYIVLYGLAKRRSVHGTLVGSISGATPPVAGYTAVTGSLDVGAILLFLILVFWQMPHFYAIAIRRIDDYKKASIPVLPIKSGMKQTKIQIFLYILAFMCATTLLFITGYAGITYLIVMLGVGLYWLWIAIKGFEAKDNSLWAKSLFLFSLKVLLVFSVMLSIDVFVP
ncbi:MAG: heme o synthase [Patescibacteria group bacterium]